jgi:hypothetical protein
MHSRLQAGIGLGEEPAHAIAARICQRKRAGAFQRWIEVDTLIIDEVSMLSSDLLTKLDVIGGCYHCRVVAFAIMRHRMQT